MRGPAKHRLHDSSLIGEGSVRAITFSVYQVVGGTGGVGEIVLSVKLMHPGTFEIAAVLITGGEGFAVLVQDLQLLRLAFIVLHVSI